MAEEGHSILTSKHTLGGRVNSFVSTFRAEAKQRRIAVTSEFLCPYLTSTVQIIDIMKGVIYYGKPAASARISRSKVSHYRIKLKRGLGPGKISYKLN